MSTVYLAYKDGASYPKNTFNPGESYPEYPFDKQDITSEPNDAYEMVRDCLFGLGYDKENYGTPEWNPLGNMLQQGQTVVIKPNLVMHENENKDVHENAMECLITHPSCIRAICDYCVIALKGSGRIVIADAPMQGCDFQALIKKMQLDEIIGFYVQKGIQVELLDLRQFQATFNKNKVIIKREPTKSKGVTVHVGTRSAHCGANCNGEYQVSDYEKEETVAHHHGNVHDYEIAEVVLQADLLINFSKPKTHRLAGFTAAMKNMVGITYNKATLPHRTAGSKREGGDAYEHKSWLKRKADQALTAKIRAEAKGKYTKALLLRYYYGAFLVAGRTFGKDNYYIGSWYGNDTIWRTVVDLNLIANYADKQGMLQDTQQRKVLCFGDMIIAGQHNGPVSPEPKPLGIVLCSEDATAFDMTVCKIMGFERDKIPLLAAIRSHKTWISLGESIIESNETQFRGKVETVRFPRDFHFMPHDSWTERLNVMDF